MTVAPSEASRRAIASPIPRDAPVTRATFPSNRLIAWDSKCPRSKVQGPRSGRAPTLDFGLWTLDSFWFVHDVGEVLVPGIHDGLGHVGDGEDRGVVGGAGRIGGAAVGQDDEDEASLLRPQDPGIVSHSAHRAALAGPEHLGGKAPSDPLPRRVL